MGNMKNTLMAGALGTALVFGSGIKDGNAEQVDNNIDNTKVGVSEVLEHDPMKQLPIDLSKEIVRNGINGNTREQLLVAKLETSRENGEYGEFMNSLMAFGKNNIKKQEYMDRFNKLDGNQKRFAKKLYESGKNDPVLLQEKSNGWLAINCIGLMERVTNLKHVIQTGDLEDGKTSDLSIQLEMILEFSPNTQNILSPTMVSKFKEIETNASLRLQEELRIAKEELAKEKGELAKVKNKNKQLDADNKKLDEQIRMLDALLVSSR